MGMHSGIYIIRHRASGCCYIGKAVNVERRLRSHAAAIALPSFNAKHHVGGVRAMWELGVGWLAFDSFVLAYIERQDLALAEALTIKALRAVGTPLFNVLDMTSALPMRSAVSKPAVLKCSTGDTYPNVSAAARENGVYPDRIRDAIKNNRVTAGSRWRFTEK